LKEIYDFDQLVMAMQNRTNSFERMMNEWKKAGHKDRDACFYNDFIDSGCDWNADNQIGTEIPLMLPSGLSLKQDKGVSTGNFTVFNYHYWSEWMKDQEAFC
jgi:hypothetical protein